MTAACLVGAAGWVATEVLESGTRYDGPAQWVPAGEPGHPGPSGDPGAELNAEPDAEPQFVRETAWEDRAVQACAWEPGPAPPLAPGPSPAPEPLRTAVVKDTAVLCVVAAEESAEYRKWGLVAPPPRTPDR